MQLESYKRINEALKNYLYELEKIDIDLFREETQKYNEAVSMFADVKDEKELNEKLLVVFDILEMKKAWEGDFDAHMSNKGATLVFE